MDIRRRGVNLRNYPRKEEIGLVVREAVQAATDGKEEKLDIVQTLGS